MGLHTHTCTTCVINEVTEVKVVTHPPPPLVQSFSTVFSHSPGCLYLHHPLPEQFCPFFFFFPLSISPGDVLHSEMCCVAAILAKRSCGNTHRLHGSIRPPPQSEFKLDNHLHTHITYIEWTVSRPGDWRDAQSQEAGSFYGRAWLTHLENGGRHHNLGKPYGLRKGI